MPAPVMHIVLGLLILPFLPDKNPQEFIVGTSFPDIRYLGVIERDKTHNPHPSWDHILGEKSSFKAGMEFHALVDIMHDRYMTTHNVYSLLPSAAKDSPHYLKFFEDILIYAKVSEWKKLASYFDTVLAEELALVNDKKSIELWHNNIKHYILKQPSPNTIQEFIDTRLPTWYGALLRLPIKLRARKIGSVLSNNLKKLFALKTLCLYIFDFYDQFPTLIMARPSHAHVGAKALEPLVS